MTDLHLSSQQAMTLSTDLIKNCDSQRQKRHPMNCKQLQFKTDWKTKKKKKKEKKRAKYVHVSHEYKCRLCQGPSYSDFRNFCRQTNATSITKQARLTNVKLIIELAKVCNFLISCRVNNKCALLLKKYFRKGRVHCRRSFQRKSFERLECLNNRENLREVPGQHFD